MKRSNSFYKRGVSAIVATVLIVMITIAAIVIIWVAVLPMIRNGLSIDDVCRNVDLTIEDMGYTCYASNNFTMVQVRKGSSNVEIVGANIIISSDGNSYSYPQEFDFVNGQSKVFYIVNSSISEVEKIGVSAIVKNGNGEKKCSAVYLENIKECAYGVLPESIITYSDIGKECNVNSDCQGYCDEYNHVCTNGSVGSGCNEDNQCVSGKCYNTQHVCTDGEVGSSCDVNSDCIESICLSASLICSNGSLGSLCEDDGKNCLSSFCGLNLSNGGQFICTNGSVGSGCNSADDCYLGYCDTGPSKCTDGSTGSSCSYPSDCISSSCVEEKCA